MRTTKRNRLVNGILGLLLLCLGLTMLPLITAAEELALAPGINLVPGAGWEIVRSRAREAALLKLRGADGRIVGRATVTISNRRSAGNAVAQLGWNVPNGNQPTISEIAGWPTVTFTTQSEPDEPEDNETAGVPEPLTRVETLVAIDNTLVRVSITLGTNPSPDVLKHAYALAQGLRTSKTAPVAQIRRSLQEVRTSLKAKAAPLSMRPVAARRRDPVTLLPRSTTFEPVDATGLQPGRELEIAVSADGQDIVIVSNKSQIFTSNNSGTTFGPPVDYPLAPRAPGASEDFQRRSDLSVVRGPSGRFYVSFLGREHFPNLNRDTVSLAVSEPQDRGNNFRFLNHAVRCEDDNVFTTDQPHMAVDPRIRPGLPDQIYVGWRANQPIDDTVNCNGGSGRMAGFHTMLSCSADGGASWTTTLVDTFGMYPRVTVGPDGMVYVISETKRGRRDGVDATMWLSKFSSCEDGLQLQTGFPSKVTDFVGVKRVPGLDRNDSGNILASPTVAVTRPRHVFVAYAEETVEGNDDIVVLGSVDDGEDGTWSLRTTANASSVPARRFMPWLCAAQDQLFVSWYDRRDATAEANDLTKYFVSFVRPVDTTLDTIPDELRAMEVSLSDKPDPQCRWWSPFAPRNRNDAERCSVQPQLAGRCCRQVNSSGKCIDSTTDGSSRNRCDFSTKPGFLPCSSGETCGTGDGHPKYGDYTGNTCQAGRAFLTWAAATNPTNGTPLTESTVFFARANVVEFTSVWDPCPDGACGSFLPTNTGELFLNCPRGNCRIVVPVTEICQSVLNCPGCGPGNRCPGEFKFEVAGMDAGWSIRLVDEAGQALAGTVRRSVGRLAITVRPEQSPTIKNHIGRYTLVLERNFPGRKEIAARIRMTASP
jgi:hypothetical protein